MWLGHDHDQIIRMKGITGLSDTSISISDGNNIPVTEHIQQDNGSSVIIKKDTKNVPCVAQTYIGPLL